MVVGMAAVCNGNQDQIFRIALCNAATDQMFNHFDTSVSQVRGGQTTLNGQAGATLTFSNFEVVIRPSFVDYLRSGWAISMVAAIDYTASNGEPSSPQSLHYLGAGMNQYEQALLSVGKIVEPYDADRAFPVFGFGGIPR